jgi:hypothetical protein
MQPPPEDAKAFIANIKRIENLVRKTGDCFVIDDPLDPYQIPLKECSTNRAALCWLIHIAEKNWATVEIMQRFAIHARAHVDGLSQSAD